MDELAHYDIPLDNETYAANAYIPAMKEFFSEVNNENWFSYVNGKKVHNGFAGNYRTLEITGQTSALDTLGRSTAYDDFKIKEKPFKMTNKSKLGTTAAYVGAHIAIPGLIVESIATGASLFAYGFWRGLEAGDTEKMYFKIPLASYQSTLGNMMNKLMKKGATELSAEGDPICKDLKLFYTPLENISFKPHKGNSEVKLKASEDALRVSIYCDDAATDNDAALFKTILGYAESKGIEPEFENEHLKNYFEAHKDDKTWLENSIDTVKGWIKK